MKKQLLTFDGGINTVLAPHLLPKNVGVVCDNVDIDKGSLSPYNEYTYEQDLTGEYVFFATDGTIIANTDATDKRSYVDFANRKYWTNGSYGAYGLMMYDGTDAGANAVAPTGTYGAISFVGASGQLTGDYSYVYTWIDLDGIESAPSPVYTFTATNQEIQITIATDTPSETVAKRRIYRTGGVNPTFNLIAELDDPTMTYTDNTRDIDVSRIELATFSNYAPPVDLTHLVENNATFWGSVDEKVYFSQNGQPEFWNSLDYITLNGDCTGIGKFADLTVAFTNSDTYIISGYNRDNISVKKLPYSEGCSNHWSITNVGQYLAWSSDNGICVFNGSTVEVVTRQKLNWDDAASLGEYTFDDYGEATFNANVGYDINYAIGMDNKYISVYPNGIGIIDFTRDFMAYSITANTPKSLYRDTVNDTLCIIIDNAGQLESHSFDTDSSNFMTATWKTGKIQDEGDSYMKSYRKVKLDARPLSVKVYVDDRLRVTIENKSEFFMPAGSIGREIQFEIDTQNEIKSLQYEYGVLNAR